MTLDSKLSDRDWAERTFLKVHDRYEKGSALGLIAAETKASADKTARLKALRLERDAAVRPEPQKALRPTAAKPVVRR